MISIPLKDRVTRYRFALSSVWPAVESFQEAQSAGERAWTHLELAAGSGRAAEGDAERTRTARHAAETWA